ncbi:CpsD/CapB family tyrosine-protein kinase [Jannaschia sp. KMU-145]|uniref:CpsD/CapB family tyrosine-protein kinase n=1 Tax=Jannaschia halovivens TaxID=3388667 RepID=UPI00396B360D
MDRLQAAIRQARAARATLMQPIGQGDIAPTHIPQDEWEMLPRLDADPDHLAKGRIVTVEDTAKSAPFDVLRTRLVQQALANDWRRIAITSPGPGCGKSTVTMNLAFSLARQPDLRTIVVDLDLRRPVMAKMLGVSRGQNVATAIRGLTPAADQMVRVGENLAFATTAEPVRDPSTLMQGRVMTAFLDQLTEQFAPDLVLIDLPPVMVSDDAIAFLPHADAAMMIAAAEDSTLGQVDAAERELASRTNVLGVVLNKCNHPGEGHAYGYGYDYGEAPAA